MGNFSLWDLLIWLFFLIYFSTTLMVCQHVAPFCSIDWFIFAVILKPLLSSSVLLVLSSSSISIQWRVVLSISIGLSAPQEIIKATEDVLFCLCGTLLSHSVLSLFHWHIGFSNVPPWFFPFVSLVVLEYVDYFYILLISMSSHCDGRFLH